MLRRSFLGLLAASPLVRAQAEAKIPEELSGEIHKLVAAKMAAQTWPAVSVAVTAGHGAVWAGAWGVADLEHNVRATPDTVFRTASIAKPITAAAVMLLVEAGKLELDTDVRTWVPEWPEKRWPVTLRQLLGHLGGVRWYRDAAETTSTLRYSTLADALAVFASDPLEHEPGTKYLYSSYGFVLAGLAAERAAARPFSDFIREQLFLPLGMRNTRLDDSRAIIQNRARGYALSGDGNLRNAPYLDTSGRWPGGGLVTTAEDLVRFAIGVPKLLKPASLAEMWTPQSTRDGVGTGYGLGWGITSFGGRRQVQHGGAQSGFASVLRCLPEDGIATAILINRQGAQHAELADSILRLAIEDRTQRAAAVLTPLPA